MKFQSGRTVGIDLGTSFSALACLNAAGQPLVVPNSSGESITASIIPLVDEASVAVGRVHKSTAHDPRRVAVAIKRQMGDRSWRIAFGNRSVSPAFLSALILKKLVGDARAPRSSIAGCGPSGRKTSIRTHWALKSQIIAGRAGAPITS